MGVICKVIKYVLTIWNCNPTFG